MKYEKFIMEGVSPWCTVHQELDTYQVYLVESLGRWYLVKGGYSVAWKNFTGMEMDSGAATKWVLRFEKNLREQIVNLNYRIIELADERREISKILFDTGED